MKWVCSLNCAIALWSGALVGAPMLGLIETLPATALSRSDPVIFLIWMFAASGWFVAVGKS